MTPELTQQILEQLTAIRRELAELRSGGNAPGWQARESTDTGSDGESELSSEEKQKLYSTVITKLLPNGSEKKSAQSSPDSPSRKRSKSTGNG